MTMTDDRELTHLELCQAVTAWALSLSWCDVAAWEVGFGTGIADVVALSDAELEAVNADRLARWELRRVGPRPFPRPRIAVFEVKRTRPDLLSDLRARKMHGYQEGASHCYLAATPAALLLEGRDRYLKVSIATAIADLHARGLPEAWGVLLLHQVRVHFSHRWRLCSPHLVRQPRQIAPASPEARRRWQARIARIVVFRSLWGTAGVIDADRPLE